jgi:uncharacterized protein YqfA (UPF0365 family)
METSTFLIILGIAAVITLIAVVFAVYDAWSLWFQALIAGAPVNPFRVAIMRMRKVDAKLILATKIKAAHSHVRVRTAQLEAHFLAGGDVKLVMDAKIKASQAGIYIDLGFLEAHHLAGGDVDLVVDSKILAEKAGLDISVDFLGGHNLAQGNVKDMVEAMIIARKADIPLNFERAAAIDLAGRNILQAVQMTVQPKVIKTEKVTAMARNGIELSAMARVTVQMDLDHLVGGAGEETILGRVGQGIVSAIGSAESHKDVLADPKSIATRIPRDELQKDTAFYVLSVDIADIDVGRNIGAKHEVQRAEAETKIAQAEAEKREQEMRVRILEMRAKVVEAEAKVPLAMSTALKKGKLGVMDYYRMKNLNADIDMRNAFAKSGKTSEEDGDEEDNS